MDTETPFFIPEGEYTKSIPQCFKKYNKDIEEFVKIERTVSDIGQLYYVFKYNLTQLTQLKIFPNGIILDADDQKVDYYKLNALTQNVIGSAVTLVNGIEAYLKDQSGIYAEYKAYTKRIYDENWYYRFFCFLRNYTQHGHLAVSYNSVNLYSFDLVQIYNTVHFNKKDKEKQMLDSIISQARERRLYPHLDYAKAISEITVLILRIYAKYYVIFEGKVKEVFLKYRRIIDDNREEIEQECEFDGFVAYRISDNNVDLIDIDSKLLDSFYEFRDEANRVQDYFEIAKF